MNTELLHKYSGAVPRYTSYPTAPHFHEGIDNGAYRRWLGALGHRNRLSLYLHIPYCDRLCWFCACHTKHTLKYEPIAVYLEALKQEIEAVGALVSPDAVVSAVHFGGGSPTMLKPEDMQSLMDCLRRHFTFGLAPEISVEMDPNDLDDSRYDALAAIGMSRASLGVQDFDDKVQKPSTVSSPSSRRNPWWMRCGRGAFTRSIATFFMGCRSRPAGHWKRR